LESWKGDLKKGEKLKLSWFIGMRKWLRTCYQQLPDDSSHLPSYTNSKRMLLFLRGDRKQFIPAVLAAYFDTCLGSVDKKEMKQTALLSAVWFDSGIPYVLTTIFDKGPVELQQAIAFSDPCMQKVQRYSECFDVVNEIELRDYVEGRIKMQMRMKQFAENKNADQGMDSLQQFLRFGYDRELSAEMLKSIKTFGTKAGPRLLKMLDDTSARGAGRALVEAYAGVMGDLAGPALTKRLKEEQQFWEEQSTYLKEGWWNGTGIEWAKVEQLRERYLYMLELIRQLGKINYPSCRETVTDFRDMWRSHPAYEDKSGLNQVSEECDELLRNIK
jgi:hypothetical protein